MTLITETAKAARLALKQAFPHDKISVTSHYDIRVVWTDVGPTVDQVQEVLLAVGCAKAETAWDGNRYLKADDRCFWFDRYNVLERAAEEQAREQHHQEWAAQEAQRRREAEEARAAASLPSTFWFAESIPAIPLLQQLNDWVIKQNEKRLPKWKFRFAPDLAVQIQSKVTRKHGILFECVAIQTENVSIKHFVESELLCGAAYWRLRFDLFSDEHKQDAAWQFEPRGATRGRDCSLTGLSELRQRIIDALHPERFTHLSPDRMLASNCMCCGKGLTDPASMARWIGPECWGNGSINIPRVFKAEAACAEQ